MDKIWLLGIALCMAIMVTSCKPKQSTYKAAYEQAQERSDTDETFDEYDDNTEFADEVDITPVSKPKTETDPLDLGNSGNIGGYPDINESLNIATRQERINPYEGESFQALRRYNVVIGSFRNRTNATALKERMQYAGYSAILAENEFGMIRVIIHSSDSKQESIRTRSSFKSKNYPDFQDAWILERSR
ncbi:MAG: SPOR domain-containing protein [Tannerellaceae bacterium]|jgi:cell division protein FtsN|nr:SPOR domain-containing protein [Tannerellaceae bacterium]